METQTETQNAQPAPAGPLVLNVVYDRRPTEEELARFEERDRRGAAGC